MLVRGSTRATLTVASFFRQFNVIGPLFLFICSTFWPAILIGSEKQESVVTECRTKSQNFLMLPKVEERPNGFFQHYAIFLEIFWIFQRVPLEFSRSFRFVKTTFYEPKGSLFRFFSNMRLFLTNTVFEKNVQKGKLVFTDVSSSEKSCFGYFSALCDNWKISQ